MSGKSIFVHTTDGSHQCWSEESHTFEYKIHSQCSIGFIEVYYQMKSNVPPEEPRKLIATYPLDKVIAVSIY